MKTPQQSYPNLAAALGVAAIYLKREDLHPYGSHKGRSIPLMMKHYIKQEQLHNFCISSSGNGALAAAICTERHNQNNEQKIHLTIFVGNNIPEKKFARLQPYINEYIHLQQVERPKQAAFLLDKQQQAHNLRQSLDEIALRGYGELAAELANIPNLEAVFVPTSSGTTLQGMAQAFEYKNNTIALHVVQSSSCHPISDSITPPPNDLPKEDSLASAIVDHVAHRKQEVAACVKKSGGQGWIATNEEITQAIALVKTHTDIDISANSALSIVGLMQSIAQGKTWENPVVCLITGE